MWHIILRCLVVDRALRRPPVDGDDRLDLGRQHHERRAVARLSLGVAHHEVVEHVDEVVALVAAHAMPVAAVPRERARPPVQHGRQRVGEHVVVAEEPTNDVCHIRIWSLNN